MNKVASQTVQVKPRTRRGPVFAIEHGLTGLSYPCGCFVPGPIDGNPGDKIKDVIALMRPCPFCWPMGVVFHKELANLMGGGHC